MQYKSLLPIIQKYISSSDAEFNDYAYKKHEIRENEFFSFNSKINTLVHVLRAWISSGLPDDDLKEMIASYENSNSYESFLDFAKKRYQINESDIRHENKEFILHLMLLPHSFYFD